MNEITVDNYKHHPIILLMKYIIPAEKWKSLHDKGFGGAVLINLSRASGTLNHDLLTTKLHVYGYRCGALKLLYSDLKNTWQRTKAKKYFTSWEKLIQWVP